MRQYFDPNYMGEPPAFKDIQDGLILTNGMFLIPLYIFHQY